MSDVLEGNSGTYMAYLCLCFVLGLVQAPAVKLLVSIVNLWQSELVVCYND
jgi:hypothetical protein